MPGIATHFEVLTLTLQELRKPIAGPALNQVAKVMDDHPQFAHLGAIGPALADFLPSPAPRGTYLSVWTEVLRILGGDLGLHNTLKQIEALMCDMDDILNDEDFDRLKAFSDRGDFDKVQDLSSNFADIVQYIPDAQTPLRSTSACRSSPLAPRSSRARRVRAATGVGRAASQPRSDAVRRRRGNDERRDPVGGSKAAADAGWRDMIRRSPETCDSSPARAWAPMRSSRRSGQAPWARCIGRAIRS